MLLSRCNPIQGSIAGKLTTIQAVIEIAYDSQINTSPFYYVIRWNIKSPIIDLMYISQINVKQNIVKELKRML